MAVASAAVGGGIGPGKAGPVRIGITWALETKSSLPAPHGTRGSLGSGDPCFLAGTCRTLRQVASDSTGRGRPGERGTGVERGPLARGHTVIVTCVDGNWAPVGTRDLG